MGNYTRGYYHSSTPEWRNRFQKTGAYVGIELELEVNNGYRALLNRLPNFRNGRSPLTEEDGSLSDRAGIELVFPPVQLKNVLRKGSVFSQSLDTIDEVGTSNHERVGMHMNVNTSGWTFLKRTMFVLVVHHMERAQLERLGGRELNTYCAQFIGSNIYDLDDLDYFYAEVTDAHSYAAEVKNNRIELRFPASTTDKTRIKYLLSFIQHLSTYSGTITDADCYDLPEITKGFLKHLYKTKSGKQLLAYMNGESKQNDSTNPTAAPATSVQRMSSTTTSTSGIRISI